jgi:hypothetical protein
VTSYDGNNQALRYRDALAGGPTGESADIQATINRDFLRIAVLALSPLQSLFQIGIAVAIGVFIDTFIIRAILVPAIASIAGDANWWPVHLSGAPVEAFKPSSKHTDVA